MDRVEVASNDASIFGFAAFARVSPLDPVALRRLRRVLEIADARQAPVREIVALAEDVPDGAGLTIDFAATVELGQPLAVLLPAAPRTRFPLNSLT